MNTNLIKKVLSLVLTLALLLGNFPATVYAAEEETPATDSTVAVEETTVLTVALTEAVEETTAPTMAVTEDAEETSVPTTVSTEPEETTVPTEPAPTEIPGETVTDEAAMASYGTCGEDLTWSISGSTLTISGTGDMADYKSCEAPWFSYISEITSVVIGDKVTSIGNYAFYGCGNMTSVLIPSSVTKIGKSAFGSCSSLTAVSIPDGVTTTVPL